MKVYVKVNSFSLCDVCGRFTDHRLWDSNNPEYDVPLCPRCYKRTRPSGVTDLRRTFNIYEWIIIIALCIIVARLVWILLD